MDEQTNEETIGRQDVHPDNMTSGRWFGRADADGWEKARTYNCMNVCRTEGRLNGRYKGRTSLLMDDRKKGRESVRTAVWMGKRKTTV